MKYRSILLAGVLLCGSALAEETVLTIDWTRLEIQTQLAAGEVDPAAGTLKLTAATDKPYQTVLRIPEPGLSRPVYALRGKVRYDGVSPPGYLQLNNHFPGHGVFFTKGLADGGPMGELSGQQPWRPFLLPFFADRGDALQGPAPVPQELDLGIHLPGSGTVYLSNLEVVQFPPGENPLAMSGTTSQWLSDANVGLVGGIAGAVVGILGGLIGTLASMGRARGFVMLTMRVLLLLGLASILGALMTYLGGQPWQVSYMLLLFGVILAAVMLGIGPTLRRRYEQHELRKMQALDLG